MACREMMMTDNDLPTTRLQQQNRSEATCPALLHVSRIERSVYFEIGIGPRQASSVVCQKPWMIIVNW